MFFCRSVLNSIVLWSLRLKPKTNTMSSFTNSSNFDNLLLQTLMGRLQIHPPNSTNNPFLSESLEDLLFDAANSYSDDDSSDSRTQLAKEESKLEREIIKLILSGKGDSLKPNSGQAVTIGEHHICVGIHEETGSDYRVWEWHGHIMLFDEENGYAPEYIYGNYFERLLGKVYKEEEEEKEEKKMATLGLRELIDGGDSGGAHILHRNINAGSPRFVYMSNSLPFCFVTCGASTGYGCLLNYVISILISFFSICWNKFKLILLANTVRLCRTNFLIKDTFLNEVGWFFIIRQSSLLF